MIFLIHQNATTVLKVLRNNDKIGFEKNNPIETLWEIAEKYPNEIIAWAEEALEKDLNKESWAEIFHHDLIMASYTVKTAFLSDTIGYIDQLPFVNLNRNVQYATWCMSTDVGGIKGKVLLKFQNLLGHIRNFGFLLNSIAKLGQQNGLFCYSTPHLLNESIRLISTGPTQPVKIIYSASNRELFSFVSSHYKNIRLYLLFLCFVKYEKSLQFWALLESQFQKKYFKHDLDLSEFSVKSLKSISNEDTIDVIIPTLGRRNYLLQVLDDLTKQNHLPRKVIVVEQNPQIDSQTELSELQNKLWPFEIVHHFTHQTGACNARNIALEKVESAWVFFADDDIRISSDLLRDSISELYKLGADCLNINCKQEGEVTIFHKVKQWGSFGSGTSIVNAKYSKKVRFDKFFEYGFGEDMDYGMQLRNVGCDIIYHPGIEILHLKASRGGFRQILAAPWEQDNPKPSPTLMVYAKKYYTPEQLKGFKIELIIRFFFKQEIKNPFKYLKMMRKRWEKSEGWAEKLKASQIKTQEIGI